MRLKRYAATSMVAALALACSMNNSRCDLHMPVTDEFCSHLYGSIESEGAIVLGRLSATYEELPCYRCGADPVPTQSDPTPYEPQVWILRYEVTADTLLYAPTSGTGDRVVVYDSGTCLREPPDEIEASAFHSRCRTTLDAVPLDRDALWLMAPIFPGDTYYLADRCREHYDPDATTIYGPISACSAPYLRVEGTDQYSIGQGTTVTSTELSAIVAAAVENATSPTPDLGSNACVSLIEKVTGRPVDRIPGGCD